MKPRTMASTTDKTRRKHCFLFDVPIELRLMIYEDAISSFKFPEEDCPSYASPDRRYLIPLLNTSTQIRAEAAKLYYAKLQDIMDTTLSKTAEAVSERWIWISGSHMIPHSVSFLRKWDSLEEAEMKAVERYRKVALVVRREMLMAEDDMKSVAGGTEMAQEKVRDEVGECCVISSVKKTYTKEEKKEIERKIWLSDGYTGCGLKVW